jgi:LmbE family N-acetylglucosaminyl deacetylase
VDEFNKLRLSGSSRVLAVAPHPDDIALSCGGLVRRLSGVELRILTCFSRSLYAPFADVGELTPELVRKIRTAEDARYARRIKAMRVDLGLEDVSLTRADPDTWLCEHPIEDSAYTNSRDAICKAIASEPCTHILCPLAVGFHFDHLITRDAVRRVVSDNQHLAYYEDLPYAGRIGGPVTVFDYARREMESVEDAAIDVTEVFAAKIADIRGYRSQIYDEDVWHVVRYASELANLAGFAERVWLRLPSR